MSSMISFYSKVVNWSSQVLNDKVCLSLWPG